MDSAWDDPATAAAYASFAVTHPMYRESSRQLVELAGIGASSAVLDLACGTGATTREILAVLGSAGRVVAVDGSAAMLAMAAESTVDDRVRFVRGPAEEVDRLVGGPVDAAVCNSAIWQTDMARTFRAVRRVLVPGGRFAFNVAAPAPGMARSHPMQRAIELAREAGWRPPRGGVSRPWQSREQLSALAEAAGFSVQAVAEFRQASTVGEQRAWLSIPVFTESQLTGLPYGERMRLVDRAYEGLDPDTPAERVWLTFVAVAGLSEGY
jgi:SAM-dependent methyltransferase